MDIDLNKEQRRALLQIRHGHNVFVTGGAGTGKSVVLKTAVQELKDAGKAVVVCAPTGIAALNIGGSTIHSVFGFPVGSLFNDGSRGMTLKTRAPAVVRGADVIILDEISMVRMDLFDAVAASVLSAEEKTGHHIQLIVAGDFFQLPPVLQKQDVPVLEKFYGRTVNTASVYAFQGVYWKKMKFHTVVLSQIMRTKDPEFARYVNMARTGDLECMPYFNNFVSAPDGSEIGLFAINADAEQFNKDKLKELPGTVTEFPTQIKYKSGFTPKNLPLSENDLPPSVSVKPGAKIIITANDWIGDCFVNGSMGTVDHISYFGDDADLEVTVDGTSFTLERKPYPIYVYDTDSDGKPVRKLAATAYQFPVLLGYAISVHRSQGQTLPSAVINPYNFEMGQLYVALSRLSSAEGLHLTRRLYKSDFKVSADVKAFYDELTGAVPKKRGRPSVRPTVRKDVLIWVPAPLADHVRLEIEKGHPLSLPRMPAYRSGRVHMRVPSSMEKHIRDEISEWRKAVR